jgi:hypothetical protein
LALVYLEWSLILTDSDLHKIFIDDESYNSGHGHAYEFYDVDPAKGAVVIVRPDQYVSMVTRIENHGRLRDFFDGFCVPVMGLSNVASNHVQTSI